ncbi:MAG: sodium:glutamate symporter, partial [Planctomycetes bacterium]|nr:sodium:glutamate symporter [Planctomycetota bacterium]
MLSFVTLCVLLGIGHLLRSKVRLLQILYLPSCVIAGVIGLAVIYGFGSIAEPNEAITAINTFIESSTSAWGKFPGFLINIVFACLFLGARLPKFRTLAKHAGPQLAYGQIVAWGQYVVGLGLWVLFMAKMFPELPAMFAGILPVGFEGGHGTAAGMGPVFAEHGWVAGQDLALTSATAGIISAIVVGMVLINIAARVGYVQKHHLPFEETLPNGVIPMDTRPSAGLLTVSSDVIETLSLHLVFIAVAIAIGFGLQQGLIYCQRFHPWLEQHKLLSSFPLFPLCMIGGLVIQFFDEKYDKRKLIDLGLIRRIQNCSLDFLVIAAIAMIFAIAVKTALLPLLILVAAGIAWNVFCVMVLARRILPDAWFERAIAEMGQSMGVTATGLLLLRVVDPDYQTEAADAFACKQIV